MSSRLNVFSTYDFQLTVGLLYYNPIVTQGRSLFLNMPCAVFIGIFVFFSLSNSRLL